MSLIDCKCGTRTVDKTWICSMYVALQEIYSRSGAKVGLAWGVVMNMLITNMHLDIIYGYDPGYRIDYQYAHGYGLCTISRILIRYEYAHVYWLQICSRILIMNMLTNINDGCAQGYWLRVCSWILITDMTTDIITVQNAHGYWLWFFSRILITNLLKNIDNEYVHGY